METENGKNGTTDKPTVAIVPSTQTDQAKGSIDAFASEGNFAAAQRMAKGLASSSLVPEAYRNNIPNVLIAMELSTRIGASVVAVMQNLDIIHGRPSWRASFLIATVNASGRFTPLRFRWEGKSGTPGWGCRAVAKDRESSEECIGSLITMQLATAEGWTTKNGSKWKTMPEQMLMYRAAAFWTRVYAPEKTLGMHTTDEIDDTFGGERVIQDAEVVTQTVSPEVVRAALEKAEAQSSSVPSTVPIEAVTENAPETKHASNCPANIGETCECA
jgi:hypothetical protein